MARTAVPVTMLSKNGNVASPAATTIDPTNGHVIGGGADAPTMERFFLEVDATFAGAKSYTIKAGVNPPALSAGQGDLVITINAAKRLLGPYESARFSQADGAIYLDVEAAATGTVRAIGIARTV